MKLSVVVPAFNEAESIAALHRELKAVCEQHAEAYEIIIVDDGSTDGTAQTVGQLDPVTLIRFRKNFGQTAAMDAGIKAARYETIVTLDGDGQNDPADIPAMYAVMQERQLDVVCGWRQNRRDSFSKRFVSRGANLLRKLLIDDQIHDSGCTLKLYRKSCFEGVSLYGEIHRFIPALLKIKGFRIGEVVVNHRPRTAGTTKYSWNRTLKGFIDMLSVWFWNKYAVRPLHLLGGAGMAFGLLGAMASAATVHAFLKGQDLSDTVWPLLAVFFLLTGLQMFISGLIADMLSKAYYETTRDVSYAIAEVREIPPKT